MHVLLVAGSVAGGVLRHLEQLVNGLEDHCFTVAGPTRSVGALQGRAAVSALWPLPLAQGPLFWGDLRARQALRERLASQDGARVELVHIHGWRAGMALLPDARRHAPVVWTVHNAPPEGRLARLWVDRLLDDPRGGPVEIIAVSPSLAREVSRRWPRFRARVWTVANGLGREELRLLQEVPRGRRQRMLQRGGAQAVPRAEHPTGFGPARPAVEAPALDMPFPVPVLGFMGRLWEPKGALDAVEVLALLVRAGWPAVLEVAGEGPHRAAMGQRAAERGVAQRVAFLGWQRPADFLARIDLLLHPSRAEGGFPYTVMEAMAAGVPVVAARVPPIEERAEAPQEGAFRQARGGLLLQLAGPGNVLDLARAAAACLNDPEGTARRAQAAAEYARRAFDLEVTLEATRRVYRAALREAEAPAREGEGPFRPRAGLARSREPGV